MQKGAAYWMGLRYFNDEDLLFLVQVQKGITNFVKILTGKNIPVQYATSGDSMTDGEVVYIASNIKEDTIDYTVGLALHEASHVLLTDFAFLNQENGKLLEVKYNIPKEDVNNVFTLINFVEDKRIDNFVYSTAPGYQFYYEELYRKSFYNDIVDRGLKENIHKTPTWNAYLFRIINIFNVNSNLDALPGLKEIRNLLTYKCINSMNCTQDAVEVAIKIYNIIKPFIQKEEEDDKKDTGLRKSLNKHLDRQKNFINANYRKKRVHKQLQKDINDLANSNFKVEETRIGNNIFRTLITDKWEKYFTSPHSFMSNSVDQGFILGKKLLSKLKNLNTENSDVLNNLIKGKLDSHKLHQAKFSENLFSRTEKERYKNTFIHISIDLSGSMQGNKINKTIQTTVALAYVACYLDNFDVEISVRGTEGDTPILGYVFNSKAHSAKYLRKLNKISPNGHTPEGICLEQVLKNTPSPTHDTNVYLLNISDGMPGMPGTDTRDMVEHTRKIINKFKKNNIGVLSYFIHSIGLGYESINDYIQDNFEKMYGNTAQFIDINNVNSIAKTINNLLVSSEKIKAF